MWVKDTLGPDRGCRGTVRFLGSVISSFSGQLFFLNLFLSKVDFVDDMADWYGVELDQPLGRHDGTVQGVSPSIFVCD